MSPIKIGRRQPGITDGPTSEARDWLLTQLKGLPGFLWVDERRLDVERTLVVVVDSPHSPAAQIIADLSHMLACEFPGSALQVQVRSKKQDDDTPDKLAKNPLFLTAAALIVDSRR